MLTVVNITIGKGEGALTVALAASPVAVVHSLPVREHETLVAIDGRVEVGNSANCA